MSDAYQQLVQQISEIGQLESVEAILDWDQETYMPPKGVNARAEQLSLLARLIHDRRSDSVVGDLLSRMNGAASDPIKETNIRETQRIYDRSVKVPSNLVGRIAKVSTHAKSAWSVARRDNNFNHFAPHLKELVELKREVADYIGYEKERYDALIDEFEPGAKTDEVAAVFSQLRDSLRQFVAELKDAPKQPDKSILTRHYPRAKQVQFARILAESIGFCFESGRIDVSTHPFCSGTTPCDVRLTTRYDEKFFSMAIFGTLHEAGHGLYEQGLDTEHTFTPMGLATSLGIHESQSRLWENIVGRSHAFWEHFYKDAQALFTESLSDVPLDAFVGAINAVHPSLIRVEADEVTYNLHIILRFELERALLDGKLDVADVPEAWNVKLDELLGIRPETDTLGCLQDIHWSMGTFGYFPTYALGNLYAAQFYAAAEKAIPDLADRIRRGDFATLLGWLRDNIHRHGQRYRPADLVKVVTGESLSVEPFLSYLRNKFSPIYGLS